MWFKEWAVLVVDDEPDILRLSEMVFRHIDLEGVPVRVYTAASKAEAIDVLKNQLSEPAGPGLLTVALIDVVMETDTAGLELCDFIRNTLRNSFAQLYIRTGQPGVAPERDVIDRYDISGYFTKVEATEDKLYSIVKSGVRAYLNTSFSLVNTMMLNDIVASSMVSQERIGESMTEKLNMIIAARGVRNVGTVIWVNDNPIVLVGHDLEDAEARRRRLLALPPVPLTPFGDTVRDDPNYIDALIHVPATPDSPEIHYLGTGTMMPTNAFMYVLIAWTMRSLALLWQAAGERAYADG
jgi:CheY-like chemotaxis protein